MRRLLSFDCGGSACAATLDDAAGATGLLIVSGGNEVRIGAHRGMARLAARLAAHGVPVLRFDRRGIGDSDGENGGYASSGPDIAAAAAAFRRACPHLTAITGFGNCDAATALILRHAVGGLDSLILANPWIVEPQDDLPPPAAIRRHYRERLVSPGAWRDLLGGRIAIGKALRGLTRIAQPTAPSALADRVLDALASVPPSRILCATGDATAIAFLDLWQAPAFAAARAAIPVTLIDTPSHSFAREGDDDRLFAAILQAFDETPARQESHRPA